MENRMVKRVVNINNVTGGVTTMEDRPEGGFFIETKTDIDPVKTVAKAEANEYRPKSMIGNTQKHHQKIGEIPLPIYHQLIEKFGRPNENPKEWRKWLMINSAFRTTGGQL